MPAYPKKLLLDELEVQALYSTMRQFSLGMAVEFLFSVSIQRNDMQVVCNGSNPRPVALRRGANTCENEFTLRCDKYIVQQKMTDDLDDASYSRDYFILVDDAEILAASAVLLYLILLSLTHPSLYGRYISYPGFFCHPTLSYLILPHPTL